MASRSRLMRLRLLSLGLETEKLVSQISGSRSPNLNTHHVSHSRKRRMGRRTESRQLFAEEAKNELNVLEAAEKAVDNIVNSSVLEESVEVSNDNIVAKNNLVQKEDCEKDLVIDITALLDNVEIIIYAGSTTNRL